MSASAAILALVLGTPWTTQGIRVSLNGTGVGYATQVNCTGTGMTCSSDGNVWTLLYTPPPGVVPGGSNTQLQYNGAGSFAGTNTLTYTFPTLNSSASAGSDAIAFSAYARLRLGAGASDYIVADGTSIYTPEVFRTGYKFVTDQGQIDFWSAGILRGVLQLGGTTLVWTGAGGSQSPTFQASNAAVGTVSYSMVTNTRLHFSGGTGNDYLTSTAGTGISTPSTITAAGFTGPLTGNASSSTALASAPTTCTSTQAATGINTLGNATGCWSPNSGVTEIGFTGTLFANLPASANGSLRYCSDCTIANPCAGGGTGAFAKRLNGAWVCN